MAEETTEQVKTGLSKIFEKAVSIGKHLVKPGMVFMMAAMAIAPVAAVAAPGAATIGDLGLSLVDHYKIMITAPFTEFGTISDAFSNAFEGNFAAESYEMGGAHGHHDMSHDTLPDSASAPGQSELLTAQQAQAREFMRD